MAIFNMIEENEATGKFKEVYEDIKKSKFKIISKVLPTE